jgi:hypothetical protein
MPIRPDRQLPPRVRIAPNTTMFAYGEWEHDWGEFVQGVYELGADDAIAVDFDASKHPHPNLVRAGAAPLESIEVFLYGLAGRELQCFAVAQAERDRPAR